MSKWFRAAVAFGATCTAAPISLCTCAFSKTWDGFFLSTQKQMLSRLSRFYLDFMSLQAESYCSGKATDSSPCNGHLQRFRVCHDHFDCVNYIKLFALANKRAYKMSSVASTVCSSKAVLVTHIEGGSPSQLQAGKPLGAKCCRPDIDLAFILFFPPSFMFPPPRVNPIPVSFRVTLHFSLFSKDEGGLHTRGIAFPQRHLAGVEEAETSSDINSGSNLPPRSTLNINVGGILPKKGFHLSF